MEELTIEDKAKRYDEVIEELRGLLEGIHEEKCDIMEEDIIKIFPELKESEDERIRKALIELVKGIYKGCCTEKACKERDMFLTWLEKQVEDVEEMIRVGNKELKTSNENIKDCIRMCLTDANEQRFKDYNTNLKECLAWLEKQGEQPIKITSKHAEGKLKEMLNDITETKDKKIKKSLINYINAHGNGGDFTKEEYINWLRKQSEKKPTFVNNFRTWLYIVADVLTEFNGIGQYLDNSDCREMAERLREKYCFDDTSSDWQKVYQKGLKVGEIYGRNKAKKEQKQKLVEWSEEDERIYRSITYSFAHNFPLTIPQQEFVKSLKDRYTWEPSDEQMQYLSWVANIKLGDGVVEQEVSKHLNELLEDLKKLREK